MENELSRCELSRKDAFVQSAPETYSMIPESKDFESERIRIWEENRRRHVESEHRILYPQSESLFPFSILFTYSTQEINLERIIHRNQVSFTRNRPFFVPVVAEQKQLRYQYYMKLYRRYKKLQDRWDATHRDEEEGNMPGRWKDDGDSKREKRTFRWMFSRFFICSDTFHGSHYSKPDF